MGLTAACRRRTSQISYIRSVGPKSSQLSSSCAPLRAVTQSSTRTRQFLVEHTFCLLREVRLLLIVSHPESLLPASKPATVADGWQQQVCKLLPGSPLAPKLATASEAIFSPTSVLSC